MRSGAMVRKRACSRRDLHPKILRSRSFELLRRDPEFIDDSADAIVTMVAPRTEMAAAE
jgi:hypothetical protein